MKYNGYQKVAIILFIIIFLSSIICGTVYKIPTYISSVGEEYNEYSFNFALMIGGWMSGFILCLFIYGLGSIIEELRILNGHPPRIKANTNEIKQPEEFVEIPKGEIKKEDMPWELEEEQEYLGGLHEKKKRWII